MRSRQRIGHQVTARLILVLVIGVVAGIVMYRSSQADLERSQSITREEYAQGFEAYRARLAEDQLPLWGSVATFVVVMLVVIGAYELLAVGIGRLLAAIVPGREPIAALDEDGTVSAGPLISRFHAMRGRVAIGVAAAVAVIVIAGLLMYYRQYEVPADADIFSALEGTWASSESECATDAHIISFTPDHSQMVIVHARAFEGADGQTDSITHYDIIEHTRGRIRGAIQGELRRTKDGKPVVWDLVLRGPDRYAWHRTDWLSPFTLTPSVVRCAPVLQGLDGDGG